MVRTKMRRRARGKTGKTRTMIQATILQTGLTAMDTRLPTTSLPRSSFDMLWRATTRGQQYEETASRSEVRLEEKCTLGPF